MQVGDGGTAGATGGASCTLGRLLLPVLLLSLACQPAAPPSPRRSGLQPVCAQLHIHQSMSEGEASFRGNVDAARRGGVIDVIWFTDHDWRMALHTYIDEFGFENGVGPEFTTIPSRIIKPGSPEEEAMAGWWPARVPPDNDPALLEIHPAELPPGLLTASSLPVSEPVTQGEGALRLQAAAAAGYSRFAAHALRFDAFRHRAAFPLAAGVKVHLSIFPQTDPGPDTRIGVRFVLSEQPPDRRAEIDYWLADSLPADTADRRARLVADRLVPFVARQWNHLTFDLTADAMAEEVGGMDNAVTEILISVEARDGKEVAAVFDDLRIEHERSGSELMAAAEEMAAALSAEGLTLYVGQEISYGVHLNALGPGIPLLDHGAFPRGLTGPQTTAFIHEHGGISMLDHMYGVGRVEQGVTGRPRAERRQVEQTVAWLVQNNAYDADAIEVGYPLRGGMNLEHHLEAWDRLGQEGVVITGVGTADTHSNRRTWNTGRPNNWTTWIWAASASMEDLMAGIRSGACAFGDPELWDGHMDLYTSRDERMGDVIIAEPGPRQVTFYADGVQPGWEARLIHNGEVLATLPVAGTTFETSRRIETTAASVVRFCLYTGDGEAAVCSNPLYFYQRPPERLFPPARRAGHGPA